MSIKLNIGGQIFETTKSTLLSIQDTYFTGMLDESHEFSKTLKDGTYFIDRDNKYFGYILKFLRNGMINIDGLKYCELKDIVDEAEYYLIEPLVQYIKESDKFKKGLEFNPENEFELRLKNAECTQKLLMFCTSFCQIYDNSDKKEEKIQQLYRFAYCTKLNNYLSDVAYCKDYKDIDYNADKDKTCKNIYIPNYTHKDYKYGMFEAIIKAISVISSNNLYDIIVCYEQFLKFSDFQKFIDEKPIDKIV